MRHCLSCVYRTKEVYFEPCNTCLHEVGFPYYKEKTNEKETPTHYKTGEYECIDVMIDVFGKEAVMHFALLNAFKYIWRNEYKGKEKDLKKAKDYIDLYLELGGEK